MSDGPDGKQFESADAAPLAFSSLPVEGDTPPPRILIAPFGRVMSAHGEFVVDAAAMQATIEAFEAHGTDLPIDFEHQSLGGPYSAPDGLAPAAGWIKSLEAVTPAAEAPGEQARADAGGGEAPAPPPAPMPGEEAQPAVPAPRPGPGREAAAGLWARVEWTPPAAERIRLRQYRYLSPVALVRRGDRRMVGLHSAALTNKPAIVGMRPLLEDEGDGRPTARAHSSRPADEPPADGEPAQAGPAEARRRLSGALRLDGSADDERLLIAAAERIGELEAGAAARDADERVAAVAAAGKLAPSQRGWARELARRDPAGFDAWAESAPLIVPLGRTSAPFDQPESGSGGAATGRAAAAERRARNEYRRNQSRLSGLCSEDAYAADARRRATDNAD